MAFVESGNLVTDKREINTSEEWDTQTDWEAFQESNGVEIVDGSLRLATVIPDSEVLDDWADGQLTSGRDDFATTPYQFETEDSEKFVHSGTRPEWTITAGSPAVSGNALTVSNNDFLHITEAADPTNFGDGLAWEIRLKSGATANGPVFRFWKEDNNNFWDLFLDIRAGNGARLDKMESGVRTNGVLQSDELPDGCLVRIEHDGNDGWEVFVDGDSEATATDSFAPTANDIEFWYASSGSGDLDSLSCYPRQA